MTVGTPFMKTIPQGAATSVFVATAPELEGIGGKYFENCNESVPKPYATNTRYSSKLWGLTEELIKNAPRTNKDEKQAQHQAEEDHEELKLDDGEQQFDHHHSADEEAKKSDSE
jgi:hypothetical protein